MQRFLLFFILLLPFLAAAQISGTKTVCASGCDYTSLTGDGGAFADISGGLNGDLILEIQGDLTEDGTNELQQWSETPTNSNFRVTIKPDAGFVTHTISGALPDAMIEINGADRVIVDGSETGTLDYSNRYLVFRNTSGPVFEFTGDAVFNTIRYTLIEGSGDVIRFGGGMTTPTVGTGNDDNSIQYCDIRNIPVASSDIQNGIKSSGSSAAISNDRNAIIFNRIYDFYNDVNGSFAGLYLGEGNNQWTIQGNSFYMKNVLTTVNTNDRQIYGIQVYNTTSGYHEIIGNYIGGDAPNAAVLSHPWTVSYTSTPITIGGIWVETASTTQETLISGNTIDHISITGNSSPTAASNFFGIKATNCFCTIQDNNIGTAGASSLVVSDAGTGTDLGLTIFGIQISGSKGMEVLRNKISNISASATESLGSATFTGIDFGITDAVYSNLTRNDVYTNAVTTIPTGSASVFAGIRTQAGSKATIFKNHIGELSDASKANTVTINNCSGCSATYSVSGILITGAGNASTAVSNIVADLDISGATTQSHAVSAISISGSATTVGKNVISKITSANANTIVRGIYAGTLAANAIISNNMITINSSVNLAIYGILNDVANASTLSVFANSVALTGSGTANTAAFYRNSSTPVSIQANIFYNSRTGGNHYAIGTSSTTNWSSDYNDLYSASLTGLYNGASQTTLVNWQTASSGDAHSNAYNPTPNFISLPNGDLRIPDVSDAGVNANIVNKGGLNPATNVVSDDVDNAQRTDIVDIGAVEVLINWIGGTPGNETSWFATGNWLGGVVPDCSDPTKGRVRIGATTYQPNITGAALFRDMVVIEGATVILSGASSLTQCADAISPYGLVNNGSLLVQGSQPITIRGDFTQNNIYTSLSGPLILDGALAGQHIGGDVPYTIYSLVIDGGTSKTLSQQVEVSNALTLTSGIVKTTSSSVLVLGTAVAKTLTGSDASYIEGPLRRKTNASGLANSYFYPVGKNGKVRPLKVTPTNSTLTAFTAEYFNQSAIQSPFSSNKESSLQTVSNIEYWTVGRLTLADPPNVANAAITLSWDAAGSGVSGDPTERQNLTVARWNVSIWVNETPSPPSTYISEANQTVRSGNVSSFPSPFTLASKSLTNPLPIELVSFSAIASDHRIKLSWETATELNNDYFVVEVSESGEKFEELTQVKGAGTSSTHQFYSAWDYRAKLGAYYYRLRQVDFDGNAEYSNVIKVDVTDEGLASITVSPNPVTSQKINVLFSSFKDGEPLRIEIMDLSGRKVREFELESSSMGITEANVEHNLPQGFYIVKASSSGQFAQTKIIINQ